MKLRLAKCFALLAATACHSASAAENMTDCHAGWSEYQRGNFMRSVELTSRCIAEGNLEHPTQARAWRNLGMGLNAAGQSEKAIEAYDIAISLRPDDVWNDHVNRGNALSDTGRYEEALRAYDTAAGLTTELGEIHYNRGIVLERMQDAPKAKESFLLAVEAGLRSEKLAERIIAHGLYEEVVDRW
jgi:tetratricopeptide (TPR) repeat protein